MTPSVGSVVHYVSYGTPGGEYRRQCRAAVVTETAQDATFVGLAVLNPTGVFFRHLLGGGCRLDAGAGDAEWSCDGREHRGGTWHWPAGIGDG